MSLTFDMRPALTLAAALLLGITVYYGVVFQGTPSNYAILQGKNDLFLHLCALLVLTLPVRLLWPHWPSIAALGLSATAIEAVRIFEPRRTADLFDPATSLLSILGGAALIAPLWRITYKVLSSNHA